MKKCSFCGSENLDEAAQCVECAGALVLEIATPQQNDERNEKEDGTWTARIGIGLCLLAVVVVFCVQRIGTSPPGFQKGDVFVVLVVLLGAFGIWMLGDPEQWLGLASKRRTRRRSLVSIEMPWEELNTRADAIVLHTIASLPKELRTEAEKVPCVLRQWPATQFSVRILDHYFGSQRSQLSENNGPIILYLGAIQHYCSEKSLDFEQQVRQTYLHEFGHHLGWEEGELEKRGLL
jgi:predicted Zn-dependent protease with MMP-like domain